LAIKGLRKMPRKSAASLSVIRNPRADDIPRPSASASKAVREEFDGIVRLIPLAQLKPQDTLLIEKLAELRIIGRTLWSTIEESVDETFLNPALLAAHDRNTARQNQICSRLRLTPQNRMTRKSALLKGPAAGMHKPWEEEDDEV
jgi:hypothetical protein